MDKELETYMSEVMKKQQYRSGVFGKFWELPNLFEMIRLRKAD